MSRKRLILAALGVAVLVFAVQGGEYSTVDLLRGRMEGRALRRAMDSLSREIDSLAAYRKALATDRELQERIARERWGMSRTGEVVYRLVDTTSR